VTGPIVQTQLDRQRPPAFGVGGIEGPGVRARIDVTRTFRVLTCTRNHLGTLAPSTHWNVNRQRA